MKKIIASSLILAALWSCAITCGASNSLYDCWSDDSSDGYHYGSEFLYFDNSSDISEDTDTAQTKSILHNELAFKEFYRHIGNAIELLPQNNENPVVSMIGTLRSTYEKASDASAQYITSVTNIMDSSRSQNAKDSALRLAQKTFFKNSHNVLQNFQSSLETASTYTNSMCNALNELNTAYTEYSTIQGEFIDCIGITDIVKTADLYSGYKEAANFKNSIDSLPYGINEYQKVYTELSEKIAAVSLSSQKLSDEFNAGITKTNHSSREIDNTSKMSEANTANNITTQDLNQFYIDNKKILNSGYQIFEDIFPLDLGPASLYPNLQINYDAYNYDAWN